jgi:hypothetical protein
MYLIHLQKHALAERIMRDILHGNQTVSIGGVPSRNSSEPSILILVPLTRCE